MYPRLHFLLPVVSGCVFIYSTLQGQRIISGIISDKATGEPLEFAAIRCKNHPAGTISNEKGEFDFLMPGAAQNDSLVFSYLGYESKVIPADSIRHLVFIELESKPISLPEISIRPVPPTYYIRMALRNSNKNYPDKPFRSIGYYRENLMENNNFVSDNDAVFASYFPGYPDTARNQHQLLLFRKGDATHKITFMAGKIKIENESRKTKEKRDGKEKEQELTNEINVLLGGPETVIGMDFLKDKELFLDTNKFHKFIYSYSGTSVYMDRHLMVIGFESKGVAEHARQKGEIYIDAASFAIVSVEYSAELIIPVLVQPLLFLWGVSVENLSFKKKLKYYETRGKWYPDDFYFRGAAALTKRHWFKRNEHSDFLIEENFVINEIKTEDIFPIREEKRFIADKKPDGQVYNDDRITWTDVNVIKKTGP
ncbi:MAG: carboxypeptidase-like regulatory domain-containing protein [Bacteroidetes bacterium]|nr:carboxypeptidase-like regulatory domain-containing protein [Bacteroidota bacterium]